MITFERVSKRFPGVLALRDVSFSVQRGACHALLGENGAGKSTLGKILAGLYQPDDGRVLIDKVPVVFRQPRDAVRAGVGIVHQELVFCPNLSVAENLCLHDLPRQGRFLRRMVLDRRALREQARGLLAQIGLELDVDRPVSGLSIAQEQLVQIAAAVGLGARVLVFDEPTSALGRVEVERLFALIRRLQAAGTTMIYVTHHLDEIFELCDTVTVLRDGQHVATSSVRDVSHEDLVRLMVGRDVAPFPGPQAVPGDSPVRLQVDGLSSPGKFAEISFRVRQGEIVGLGGLVGAGRSEIVQALFGLDPRATGRVQIDGRPMPMESTRAALRHRLGLIPEDRKQQGLVLGMSVRGNLTLPFVDRFRQWWGGVSRGREVEFVAKACDQLSVRTPSWETAISTLSGGNQQKVIFARWLSQGQNVLLIDEPTRGVDVGAKREIHDLIAQTAANGTAVLLVSSDLPELLALSHRVLVLRQGRLVSELSRSAAQPETVLRHMAGLEG